MPHATNTSNATTTERTLGAHRLAQYISRNRCERYLRLALFPSEAKPYLSRYKVNFESLSPLLSEAGQSFERESVEELGTHERVVDLQNTSAEAFIVSLKAQPTGRTFYYQPRLEGQIGECSCEGYPDLVEVDRLEDGLVDATVIDIKASRRETVGYRLQVAFYARMLREALRIAGLTLRSMRGAVAARDAEFIQDGFQTFDLDLYLDEIEHLVAAPDSDVSRMLAKTFQTASYHLGSHCNGCPYNAVCFIETAERDDLSLLPALSVSEKSSLRTEGIKTVRDLALLMDYGKGAMVPAPGRESDVERVGSRWPLGSRLPILTQRARTALRRLDPSVEAKRYLLGSDWGSLPDPSLYPNLIKVFVDAQRDHLEDRVYLMAGLVVGPSASTEVIEMTDSPPDTDAERDLLIKWMQRLLPAIASVSDSSTAPLHVYLYDRRGQRSLLDALSRHFDALCAIPAFYDLLTSTPALTQSMVSFLADEVCERLNLGSICRSLYDVARELGFRWSDGRVDAFKSFREKIFDNVRPFTRASDGLLQVVEGKEQALRIEAAARFGTEIPLEYAYAAWGILKEKPEMSQSARAQIRGFLSVNSEDIRALTSQRLRALRHIEEHFKYKNKQVEKQALVLDRLDQTEVDPEIVPLSRSLEDFLYLEHYASVQEKLLHSSLPPDQRVSTGRTAILRCGSYEKNEDGEEYATLSFVDPQGKAITLAEIDILRFREGDWVVLNPLRDDKDEYLSAWRITHGRLAVIEEIGEVEVHLRLLPMNFRNSEFRYTHRIFKPEAGTIYTIDEMVDDLNADKFLDACRHASSNCLYRWLTDVDEEKRARAIRPKRLRDAVDVARLAALAQKPHGLTDAQNGVIGGYLKDRVLVLQGPPGTGKSHTLGFAVLSRALALGVPTRPFRIAVTAKTHAATMIALGSIAKRARELLDEHTDSPSLEPLSRLKVVKICNDPSDSVPEGVERIFADGGEELKAAEQWAMLLEEPLLVIGGTPGGLYKLIKQGASKGRAIDWTQELFDLVIVDEASQMGIAEALTAAAFLRDDGQFIAIGDHRQMPPILAHAWDQESRRDLERVRPHLSIFEYLRELGFTSAALDESFRIPAEIADFLQRHIYAQDGIQFRSKNRARINELPNLRGWLRAALAPEYPLIVIEHDESGSQRSNEFEASLVEEIVRVAGEQLGLDSKEGIGVVVPHRAQKALLQERLPEYANSIDTVERFQGGERDLIIVSATVSDREFARMESSFLLEPRRLTVAISRPKKKLVIISSRAVFDLIPGDLDEYERGALWKHLRHESEGKQLWQGEINNHRMSVRALG